MATEHILYLPRSDHDGEYVLVNVSSEGPSPLDLKLIATEGESPYIATIRQSQISQLRDKRNQLSDDQWETVLHSSLLQRRFQGSEASTVEKLQIIATVTGDQLSVLFRNNISGITQKLGQLVFKKDESQEIDIIGWTGTAVKKSELLDREVQELTSRYDEQSKKVEKLSNQLEDLIKAKIEHENSLLHKCRELLNTKKLKIRDQQRLLASGKVDPKQAAKLQDARLSSKARAATASRAGKRKAKGGHQASDSSEESGFEQKAPQQKSESDLSEQINTPEHSDHDVTEDESGDGRGSAPQAAKSPDKGKAADGAKEAMGKKMQLDMPPTRDLACGEGGSRERAKWPGTEDTSTFTRKAGSEDEETDDDEL